jgi:hypothetical protein
MMRWQVPESRAPPRILEIARLSQRASAVCRHAASRTAWLPVALRSHRRNITAANALRSPRATALLPLPLPRQRTPAPAASSCDCALGRLAESDADSLSDRSATHSPTNSAALTAHSQPALHPVCHAPSCHSTTYLLHHDLPSRGLPVHYGRPRVCGTAPGTRRSRSLDDSKQGPQRLCYRA